MNIKAIGIASEETEYRVLKEQHTVSQGWPDTKDLSFLFQTVEKVSDYLDYFGYVQDKKLRNFANNFFEIQTGDIILACEGQTIKGICEIPEDFVYFYNPDNPHYPNSLFPVLWVDWDDFCNDETISKAGGQFGPIGIINSGKANIRNYIEANWESYKKEKNISIQPQSCSEKLQRLKKELPEKQKLSKMDYKQRIEKEVSLPTVVLETSGSEIVDYTKCCPNNSNNSNLIMNDKEIKADIVKVRCLLENKNLRIPPYQRPYRWAEKNVRQLLEDVLSSMNAGKNNYRIGSIILHNNKTENVLDVVDGQQRLTTLYILLNICNKGKDSCPLNFGSESYNTIKQNYRFIQAWIEEHAKNNLTDYINYVLDSCDFVQIEVSDLTEAFQMFDSQNGRGKELEPYNLLKAYHIRAMEQDSREEKIRCDKCWEAATQYDPTPKIKDDPNIDILKQIFDEQLFRSRLWSRQNVAKVFSKESIDEFKGFTIDKNHPALFPYQNPQLLQYLTAKFYDTILSGTAATKNRFELGDNDHINPFVNINQQIVNGKGFFEYVETYVEIYKQMFIDIGSYKLSEFKEFYYMCCLNYNWNEQNYSIIKDNRKKDWAFNPTWPAARSGDTYLREAYKSAVFVLFDKFGEKGLNKYYKTLYRLIYVMRIEKSQVRYNSVAEMPCKFFKIIATAKDLADLSELDTMAAELSKKNFDAKNKKDKKIDNDTIINLIITGEWKIWEKA